MKVLQHLLPITWLHDVQPIVKVYATILASASNKPPIEKLICNGP